MAAAGRPEVLVDGWDDDQVVTEYEREAWRTCVRSVLTVYNAGADTRPCRSSKP